MVSKMEGSNVLNLYVGRLISLTLLGSPPVEMIDGSLELLTLLAIAFPWLTGIVQMFRKLMGALHQYKVLRQFSKKVGKLRAPSSMTLNSPLNYFRIAQDVDLSLRKLENLITSQFPEDTSRLELFRELKGKVYHYLDKRFHWRG